MGTANPSQARSGRSRVTASSEYHNGDDEEFVPTRSIDRRRPSACDSGSAARRRTRPTLYRARVQPRGWIPPRSQARARAAIHLEETKVKTRADGRRQCAVCSSLFSPHVHGRRKYCSDKCSTTARSFKKTCLVCHNDFVTQTRNTKSCTPACSKILRERQRQKYLVAHAAMKAKRRRGLPVEIPPARATHLDDVKNPFAGALNASERAELRDRLDYIRAVKSNQGNANMGQGWSQGKRL